MVVSVGCSGGKGRVGWKTHKNHGCGVAEGVKVDELLDFGRQAKQHGAHDVGEVARQFLHVVAHVGRWLGRLPVSNQYRIHCNRDWRDVPVIFSRLNQVVNLAVDQLEDALLRRLLSSPEVLRRVERDGPGRRA